MSFISDLRPLIPGLYHLECDRLILWVPVLLACGVAAYFALPREPALWQGMAALFAALLACRGFWRFFWLRLLFFCLLTGAAGFLAAKLHSDHVKAPVLRKVLYQRAVEGVIDDIQLRENGRRLYLTQLSIAGVQASTTPARISITLKKDAPGLSIGDRVRMKAMLFPPPAPAMPGAYDFARDFYFKRIGAVGFTYEIPQLVTKDSTSARQWLNALRLSLNEKILSAMPGENGAVAAALMVGEQSAVSEEVSDAMRDSGIYHVLSISGLHMSLAAGLIFFTVRLLLSLWPPLMLRWPVKKIAAAAGLISAFIYLLLAGCPVPALRSFIMVACVLAAVLLDRSGISLYSLAWAAVLILLTQPESMLGASFQLSFAATLGIVTLYERYGHALYKSDIGIARRLWLYFFALMLTSLVATLATTPLVLYHFNRMTVWGIGSNMLLMPLVSFWIMPSALLAFVLMPFGLEHWPLGWLDSGIGFMIAGARWFAGLPLATLAIPSPHFIGLCAIILGGLWLCLWKSRAHLLGIPLIIIGLATILLHKPYDMLISDDASKIAVRLPTGDFLFLRGKPDSFDGEIWLRAHGQETGLMLKDMKTRADAPACDKNKCIMDMAGKKIAVALRKDVKNICAENPDIVITGDVVEKEQCAAPLIFDRYTLMANGTTGLRFHNTDVEIDTAASHRGQRPWVPRPYSRLYVKKDQAITEE